MNAFKTILATIGLVVLLPFLVLVGGLITGAGWQAVGLALVLVTIFFNGKNYLKS